MTQNSILFSYKGFHTVPTEALVGQTTAVGSREAAKLTTQKKTTASIVSVAAFGVAFVAVIASVLGTTMAIYEDLHDTRDALNCFRLRRRKTTPSLSIVISMGRPLSTYELLIDLGAVHSSDNSPSTTLFSRNIFLSELLQCNTSSKICNDFVLVEGSGNSQQEYAQLEFVFSSYDPLATFGFDGVTRPSRQSLLEVSTTHACFGNKVHQQPTTGFEHPLNIDGDRLTADPETVRALFPDSPAGECGSNATLFPVESLSPSFSTVVGQHLVEKLATNGQLQERTQAIERGVGQCARNDTVALDLQLDCELLGVDCLSYPTVPYRHVQQSTLALYIGNDTASMSTERRKVYYTQGETGAVILRLVVSIVIAFTFFSRASFSTSTASRNALRFFRGKSQPDSFHVLLDALGDLGVGFAALLSRAVAFLSKRQALRDGGLGLLCNTEITAMCCSLLHIIMRNLILDPSVFTSSVANSIPPRDRLGGSMALGDASVAACLAVVTLPVLATTGGDSFDDIARLLGGSLVILFVIVRVLHSFFACVLLAASAALDGDFEISYVSTLVLSSLFWIVQLVSISVALSTMVLIPVSYSLTRQTLQDATMPTVLGLGALCLVGVSVRKSIVSIVR
tara:strand:- start:213 stop:2087 length:1875 start_codon:yes stop_codon:yes gene_type:complete